MKFVYSRVAAGNAAGLMAEPAWLGGASTRGLPYRRAWIAHPARAAASDIWGDMAFTAPSPQRRPTRPDAGQRAYILQQDPNGLWFVDAWGNTTVGAIRPTPGNTPVPPPSSRDLAETCFIIELGRATRS